MFSIIVAMDENQLIGYQNQLPWKLPNDLKYVKKITTGKTIIMGRKNFESIGRALPNRRNIVLTNNEQFEEKNVEIAHSFQEVVQKTSQEEEKIIFGGAQIYKLFLPYVSKIYLTRIKMKFYGDTYFPKLDWSQWELISKTEGKIDEKNKYEHAFFVYKKKGNKKI